MEAEGPGRAVTTTHVTGGSEENSQSSGEEQDAFIRYSRWIGCSRWGLDEGGLWSFLGNSDVTLWDKGSLEEREGEEGRNRGGGMTRIAMWCDGQGKTSRVQ